MEIGDIYQVKNPGYIYSSYRKFSEKYGYPDAILDDQLDFGKQDDIIKGRKVKILAVGKHEDDGKTLVIVETFIKNKPKYRFIIGIDGLESI